MLTESWSLKKSKIVKTKSKFGSQKREIEIGEIIYLAKNSALKLDSGVEITNFPIAYQTYGKLNQDKSNAVLICHALTGDQYVASKNPVTNKDGWWEFMIGKNKAIDTDKFFVICSNIIGGCMGSFGPKEIDEKNGEPYGINFPFITIHDMVKAQNLLIESLGIKKLHAVIGGSTGGMQVLSWTVQFPEKVKLAIPLATSYRHTPQNIAFHEVGRQAIITDNNWNNGCYLIKNTFPKNGLAVARMAAHITYLSEKALQNKFGRDLQDKKNISFSFSQDFQVESYLHYQGFNFVERFDPNSYLYISKAVDYFDLEKDFSSNLSAAFSSFASISENKFCVISFSDDWLFPPSEAKKLTKALISANVVVSSVIIESNAGHDSFLIKNSAFEETIKNFINQN